MRFWCDVWRAFGVSGERGLVQVIGAQNTLIAE